VFAQQLEQLTGEVGFQHAQRLDGRLVHQTAQHLNVRLNIAARHAPVGMIIDFV
jgi:hypothetical protein